MSDFARLCYLEQMRTIKLMADYDCWPLWEADPGRVGNINPDDLPISQALKNGLKQWAAEFDATLDRSDPARSKFASVDAESAFTARGLALAKDLQVELGEAFQVQAKLS